MTLKEIINTMRTKRNTPIHIESSFANGKHYIIVQKASLMEMLKREFDLNQETGKTLYYNDPHDAFFLEDNDALVKRLLKAA